MASDADSVFPVQRDDEYIQGVKFTHTKITPLIQEFDNKIAILHKYELLATNFTGISRYNDKFELYLLGKGSFGL